MPLPAKAAGSAPPAVTVEPRRLTAGFGAATTRMWTAFERRPARSRTVIETLPARVPAGTRATQPVRERCSSVASAPRDQRKLTRSPGASREPRSWTCLPTRTATPAVHAFAVAGTQRAPLSWGTREAAWAPAAGSSARVAPSASRARAAALGRTAFERGIRGATATQGRSCAVEISSSSPPS
jgi:hypothetical protein